MNKSGLVGEKATQLGGMGSSELKMELIDVISLRSMEEVVLARMRAEFISHKHFWSVRKNITFGARHTSKYDHDRTIYEAHVVHRGPQTFDCCSKLSFSIESARPLRIGTFFSSFHVI